MDKLNFNKEKEQKQLIGEDKLNCANDIVDGHFKEVESKQILQQFQEQIPVVCVQLKNKAESFL
jgi:hypothetical protein